MFGDFSTLIADQVINSLSKFRWMYNEQVEVPVVIRTPMGGRRGYGPTHSQTLEKLYLGIPGIRVLAANSLSDPGELLRQAILDDPGPVLFVENKLLYLKSVAEAEQLQDYEIEASTPSGNYAPTLRLSLKGSPSPTLTLAAYGYMADLALEGMQRLAFEHEIFCELVVPSQLAPFGAPGELDAALLASLQTTGRLLTIEEGSYSLGWGAEIAARAAQVIGAGLKRVERLAAAEHPIPASLPLEAAALPGVEDILAAAQRMV
jgi:pyruvate/2-oxoglutarate/acetoin dehydrogenase E1 component